MTFLRAKTDEDDPCLINSKDIGLIVLMNDKTEEFPYAIRAWISAEERWITFGEFETEAAAEAKFSAIERAANGQQSSNP